MVPTSVLGNLRDKAKLGLVPRDVPREVELSPIDDGYVPDVKMSDKARQAAAGMSTIRLHFQAKLQVIGFCLDFRDSTPL